MGRGPTGHDRRHAARHRAVAEELTMELRDRVVVVTGAASGIGAALADRIAQERPSALVLADIDGGGVSTVAAQLTDTHHGLAVEGVRCDVADGTQIEALVGDTTD